MVCGLVVITDNFFRSSYFYHLVAELIVDAIVAADFIKVDNVLEVPAYQYVGFGWVAIAICWQSAQLVRPTTLARMYWSASVAASLLSVIRSI